MNKILETTKNKTFKGYTILYRIEPPLDDMFDHVLEEIYFHLNDERNDIVPHVNCLYGSNEEGNAIRNISPNDIEMKFYEPGEYLNIRNYQRS